MQSELAERAAREFEQTYDEAPVVAARAPGRVEVLGNHTDYNDGFVLSAAINLETLFMARPSPSTECILMAADVHEQVAFDCRNPEPDPAHPWANYVLGVTAGLASVTALPHGFKAIFRGNIPLGAGLSSSAALEMSSGVALAALYQMKIDPHALARIGQQAEHRFAGVKCGLLDQFSSLFGKSGHLVMSDFRSLDVEQVPMGEDACFLMCNTRAQHALVDGEYNERRASCEAAAQAFAGLLDHPVSALRDVSWSEYESLADRLDPVAARRAAHVIGENERVQRGRELLRAADLPAFGELMFASHESSRTNFENSCPELDLLVDTARHIPGVLGARLSGGGFGGSAVVLLHPRDVETASKALQSAYRAEFNHPCDIRIISPSDGASLLKL